MSDNVILTLVILGGWGALLALLALLGYANTRAFPRCPYCGERGADDLPCCLRQSRKKRSSR